MECRAKQVHNDSAMVEKTTKTKMSAESSESRMTLQRNELNSSELMRAN